MMGTVCCGIAKREVEISGLQRVEVMRKRCRGLKGCVESGVCSVECVVCVECVECVECVVCRTGHHHFYFYCT